MAKNYLSLTLTNQTCKLVLLTLSCAVRQMAEKEAPRVFVEYIPAHAQNIPKLEYYSNPRLCMFRQAMLSESITGQEFSL
jgi:hypothetical protein